MKSDLAWHSRLFTSDLPTAKILLKTWRGFGSLRWAAAAQLKLFCLRKLINDCCHDRWRRGNLGSSARVLGKVSQTFQERGSPLFYTPGGEVPWAQWFNSESKWAEILPGCSRQVLSPSFFLWTWQSFGLLYSGCWARSHLALHCRWMEWERSHS